MLLHCMTSNIFSLGDYFVPKVSSLNRSDYLFFCNLFCFQIQCCNTVLLYVILLFGDLFCFIQSSSFFLKHFSRPRILFNLGQLEVILFQLFNNLFRNRCSTRFGLSSQFGIIRRYLSINIHNTKPVFLLFP